ALHLLALGLIVLAVKYLAGIAKAKERPPDVRVAKLLRHDLAAPGGGGGSPKGKGPGPGAAPEQAAEHVPQDPEPKKPAPAGGKTQLPEDDVVRPSFQGPDIRGNPQVKLLIDRGVQAAAAIAELDEGTRAKLSKGLRKGEGKSGPGSGGGEGSAVGASTGST